MKSNKLRLIIILALLLLTGVIFFISTSPEQLPVALLIVPFLYIFMVTYLTCRLVFMHIVRQKALVSVLSAMVAVGVTMLLLLSSLHQLTIRDIILTTGIAGIFIWYMRKVQS